MGMINRIRFVFAVAALWACSMAAQAQAQDSTFGSVTLTKDPRIDVLAKKQYQLNKVSGLKNSSGQYKGYRIMIVNTNNRETAYNARTELLRMFPEHALYMAYQAPYYKLKMGDFIKREDAEKVRKQIPSRVSQSLFIIQDIIKIKPEDEAKLLAEEN
jgi:hypothetical protein